EWGSGMAEQLADSFLAVRLQRRPDDVRELTLEPHGERWEQRVVELVEQFE
ncbi:MAG: tRNA (adenosine(37)-N6)-threonylcarbamoyltransferase complex ATPase subunit type 1 TsaE, partial [Saccharopolyspora rectivirgula]